MGFVFDSDASYHMNKPRQKHKGPNQTKAATILIFAASQSKALW